MPSSVFLEGYALAEESEQLNLWSSEDLVCFFLSPFLTDLGAVFPILSSMRASHSGQQNNCHSWELDDTMAIYK